MIEDGFPDQLVRIGRAFYPAEVKDMSQIPSKRKLTPDRVAWWRRHGIEPSILETLDDCARFIHAIAALGNSWATNAQRQKSSANCLDIDRAITLDNPRVSDHRWPRLTT